MDYTFLEAVAHTCLAGFVILFAIYLAAWLVAWLVGWITAAVCLLVHTLMIGLTVFICGSLICKCLERVLLLRPEVRRVHLSHSTKSADPFWPGQAAFYGQPLGELIKTGTIMAQGNSTHREVERSRAEHIRSVCSTSARMPPCEYNTTRKRRCSSTISCGLHAGYMKRVRIFGEPQPGFEQIQWTNYLSRDILCFLANHPVLNTIMTKRAFLVSDLFEIVGRNVCGITIVNGTGGIGIQIMRNGKFARVQDYLKIILHAFAHMSVSQSNDAFEACLRELIGEYNYYATQIGVMSQLVRFEANEFRTGISVEYTNDTVLLPLWRTWGQMDESVYQVGAAMVPVPEH